MWGKGKNCALLKLAVPVAGECEDDKESQRQDTEDSISTAATITSGLPLLTQLQRL